MVDTVTLNDRTKYVMDNLFKYVGINNISVYVYKTREFPYMTTICKEFRKAMKDNHAPQKLFHVKQLNQFDARQSDMVIFTLLLNNTGVNDIIFQYNEIQNLIPDSKESYDVFQVIINCHYTDYVNCIDSVIGSIQSYIENKFANRAKIGTVV